MYAPLSGLNKLPFRIINCNQSVFLCSRPAFQFLLAGNGGVDIRIFLYVNKIVAEVAASKGFGRTPVGVVSGHAVSNIIGDAEVQYLFSGVGGDVHVVGHGGTGLLVCHPEHSAH